jgi:hypothetical protein
MDHGKLLSVNPGHVCHADQHKGQQRENKGKLDGRLTSFALQQLIWLFFDRGH